MSEVISGSGGFIQGKGKATLRSSDSSRIASKKQTDI